jgi:hypothetical protein
MLDRFEKNSVRSKALSETLDRYRVLYAEANCEWGKIQNAARKHALGQIARNPILFGSYARALFITGQKEKCAEL